MKTQYSFRQKLAGAFALLLSLILFHSVIAWFALQELGNRFGEIYDVDQIVETTIRARVNEKNYVLSNERHLAITVLEELQEAHDKVEQMILRDSSLDLQYLRNMSNLLDIYRTSFSQYVIDQDQKRALNSEGARLAQEFWETVGELRQMNGTITDADVNKLYWFLLVTKGGSWNNEEEHAVTTQAGQEIATLTERLLQEKHNTDVRLSAHRIVTIMNDYLQVLDKIKLVQDRQRGNELQMEIAAEAVQLAGKVVAENQREKVSDRQRTTTNLLLTVFLISTGIALGGTIYLSTRLIRPLQDLVRMTAALGQGKFQERIDVEGEDEFRILLTSVNKMAENIENLNSNMEQMVEERTNALELEKIRFEKLFENSPDGILIFDENMYVLNVNHSFTSIFGYSVEDIRGHRLTDFLFLEDQTDISGQAINVHSPLRLETVRRCKDGTLVAVSIVRYSFQQPIGQALYYAIYTDISERKASEEQLRYLSFHDSLTALKNRTYFELEMGKLQVSQSSCGIIVCDVDGLKIINDQWGHAAGDQLLRDAAQVLSEAAGDLPLARVGGDEFVIFLPSSVEEDVQTMVESIQHGIVQINMGRVYPLQMSVGYAYRTNGNISMGELLTLADKMMYAMKKSRRQQQAM